MQLALDAVVIGLSVLVLTPGVTLLSALRAIVLNLGLATNHRPPGRYAGM